ncbi:MAG: hypothetical protein QOG21_1705 [Actinomycetota bacterium]|jgi:hypothetical protein|nr:hypothetical protein [Actinomycetota bacterium]
MPARAPVLALLARRLRPRVLRKCPEGDRSCAPESQARNSSPLVDLWALRGLTAT